MEEPTAYLAELDIKHNVIYKTFRWCYFGKLLEFCYLHSKQQNNAI